MTRIAGRDLSNILASIVEDREGARKEFTLHRLLRIFQDVCQAVAYAHDHGVVHRDLKPSNIMVGRYGEVYVVDWGLAKTKGLPDPPSGSGFLPLPKESSEGPALTLEGEILGTPAYMPPEQAEGRIEEIDERSDIYSLGALLYEMLTFHPPFEGETFQEIISQVVSGVLTPPLTRISEIRESHTPDSGDRSEEDSSVPPREYHPESVPPELNEIILKAMAKEKSQRYGTVRELFEEIQRFLEGEKEREHNHQMAMSKVEAGRRLMEKMKELRADLKEVEKKAEEAEKEIEPYWPVERKKGFWTLQDQAKELRQHIVDSFIASGAEFEGALEFERGNKEARSALADLYWDQYLREEAGEDEAEMRRCIGLVRRYNDGQYDALLKGDGTLSVATRQFPCRCLTDGRMVASDEMEVLGYHPLTGRALDGSKGAEGLPELEPKGPIPLKVHGAECETEPLEGVEVWLYKYGERNRVLLPLFPEGVGVGGEESKAPSPEVLDRLFDSSSPFRPAEGMVLGKTPVGKFPIPMGSYLLILHKEGFHPVLCPLFIGRLAEEAMNVTLYREGEIPEGFIQVPAGKFIYQGGEIAEPKEIKETEDFFIAKFPVTCREYLAFLNDLTRPDQPDSPSREGGFPDWKKTLGPAEGRVPRESEQGGTYWPRGKDGRTIVPTESWLAEAPEAMKKQARRLPECPVDWEEEWPVFGVSWEDVKAFSAWQTQKRGMLFCMPHEIQWEKAARGPDGRFYPWGNHLDETFCNSEFSHASGARPCPVDSFPMDESPYGGRGLSGNSRDICMNDAGGQYAGWRMFRGGFWCDSGSINRVTYRTCLTTFYVFRHMGVRLACLPRARCS
jgi:formylglycine-generating enzyme required for sulfatase activity